jgi:FkbM family methyltransferase
MRELERISRDSRLLEFLKALEPHEISLAMPLLDCSRAQLFQDLLAVVSSGAKRNGYFVEFGATNGVELSNTWLLEKQLGWTGILAEPARVWHEALRSNRNCIIETDCVWKETGISVDFAEADNAVLSTIDSYKGRDLHAGNREEAKTYPVRTVSLIDMLRRYNAPRYIDLLSIDTEGSEFELLSAFDFSAYDFGCIVVEHNFTDNRERLHSLLVGGGYRRIMTGVSKFDDWYLPLCNFDRQE